MSSTASGEFPAERCIDGREGGSRSGSMCHTGGEKAPWLALDFGAQVLVERIVINNRDDCCGDRLRNVEVRVADQLPDSGQEMFKGGRPLATFKGPAKNREVVSLTSNAEFGGRFLIVQINNSPGTGYLNLNEVTVWGKHIGIVNQQISSSRYAQTNNCFLEDIWIREGFVTTRFLQIM